MNESGSCTVGFLNQSVTINYNGRRAKALVDFLCSDLETNVEPSPGTEYDVIVVGRKPMMSLWQQEKKLYFGECSHSLAHILINEIIYRCIIDVDCGHAVHAAAIHCPMGGILFPGKSGSGKSTLTAWFTAAGCSYLTDELVVLAGDRPRIHPFTRPISLKTGSIKALSSFVNITREKVLSGEKGLMLPHRLLNSNFFAESPLLTCIIFPEFKAGAITKIIPLTSGVACSRLIECYVNARNIQGHGISQLVTLTREIPAFQLIYSSFTTLHKTMSHYFPEIFRGLSPTLDQ